MDTGGRPHAPVAGNHPARAGDVDPKRPDPKGPDPKGPDPGGFDRRRRARNWALLAVLLGLAALFYAITLVKLTKGG
jgi:hypothetical protein